MKIIFTKNAPYGGACVQKGSMVTSSMQKTYWEFHSTTNLIIISVSHLLFQQTSQYLQGACWYQTRWSDYFCVWPVGQSCLRLSQMWAPTLLEWWRSDCGFYIQDLLAPRNIILNIPPFLGDQAQLPAKDVNEIRWIATIRIHVEEQLDWLKHLECFKGCSLTLFTTTFVPWW